MNNKLWEISYIEFKGGKAHIKACTAKEAIEKFEAKHRLEWIDRPYTVMSVIYLGTVTE